MRFLGCSLSAVLVFGVLACEKKEENRERSAEAAASVDRSPALDPALAKAVAQASASRPTRGPAAAGGPPPSGVFGPGGADREARRGDPPKVTLGDRGSEPRVTLGPMQPKPGWKGSGTVLIASQQDPRQGAVPIRVNLTLEAQKPKATDAGAEGAGLIAVTARVTSAEIDLAGVPTDLSKRIAGMKGARIDYLVAPDGSGNGFHAEHPNADFEIQQQVRVVSDTLALVTLPVPNVPLGQGGFWMTTTREGVFGLDLVTYRMIKVEKLSGDTVTLSINTKRYAASNRFDFEGLQKDAPRELVEFDAKSDGRIELKVGKSFPSTGQFSSLLGARLGSGQQGGTLQVQSRIGLAFGDKDSPAPKLPSLADSMEQAPQRALPVEPMTPPPGGPQQGGPSQDAPEEGP